MITEHFEVLANHIKYLLYLHAGSTILYLVVCAQVLYNM